ncbi:MAG: hypothetical protein AB4290_07710, partial [Spirulina sp.]
MPSSNQSASSTWDDVFNQVAAEGHPIGDLVKATLKEQFANALLPIVVEDISDESMTLSYAGEIDTKTVAAKIPLMGKWVETLELSQHLPTIENPVITVNGYEGNNPQFELEIPQLSTTALQPLMQELGIEKVSDGGNFSLGLSAEQVQVVSLDPLSATEVINLIPTVKDFAEDLELPELIIENPGITVTSPTEENPQYQYQFSASRLPIAELQDWLVNYIAKSIPQSLKDTFNELAEKVENISLEVGENSIKVTYLETLNVSDLVNGLSTEIGLGSIDRNITVQAPSLFIQETENADTGEAEYFYEVSLPQVATGEVVALLGDFTHIAVLQDLQSLGALDLTVSSEQVQLHYGDAIDIVSVVDYFADKIQPFDLPDSFTQKGEEFDLTLVKGSEDFAFSTVYTAVTPMGLLDAFDLEPPKFVQSLLGKTASIEFAIENMEGNESISMTYLGGVDIGEVIGELSSSLGYNAFDTSFGIYNPNILIEGTGDAQTYQLTIPEVSPKEAVDLLVQLGSFGAASQSAINKLTESLEALGTAAFVLTEESLSLEFNDDIEFDLGAMFSFNGTVPLVDSAIDRIVDTFLNADNGNSTLADTKVALLTADEQTALGLSGSLNEQEFDFVVTKDDVALVYNSAKDLDLAEVAKGVPILQDFELLGTRVILLNGEEYTIEHEDFGELELHQGAHLLGTVDFTKDDKGKYKNDFSQFINDKIGLDELDVHVGLQSAGLATMHGAIDGNMTLIGDANDANDFQVTFNNAILGLQTNVTGEPTFGLEGNLTLENYDFVQDNEPILNLAGGIKLEPESVSVYTNGDFQGSWDDPFGFKGASVRQIAVQTGGTYIAPYIDNFGLIGDLKWGEIDVELGFSLDANDPDNYAFIFTPNKAIGLTEVMESSLIP